MSVTTIEERIADAENAYHLLQTGQSVVEVQDQNGERIKYRSANRGELAAYINTLKSEKGGTPRGPMKVLF